MCTVKPSLSPEVTQTPLALQSFIWHLEIPKFLSKAHIYFNQPPLSREKMFIRS